MTPWQHYIKNNHTKCKDAKHSDTKRNATSIMTLIKMTPKHDDTKRNDIKHNDTQKLRYQA